MATGGVSDPNDPQCSHYSDDIQCPQYSDVRSQCSDDSQLIDDSPHSGDSQYSDILSGMCSFFSEMMNEEERIYDERYAGDVSAEGEMQLKQYVPESLYVSPEEEERMAHEDAVARVRFAKKRRAEEKAAELERIREEEDRKEKADKKLPDKKLYEFGMSQLKYAIQIFETTLFRSPEADSERKFDLAVHRPSMLSAFSAISDNAMTAIQNAENGEEIEEVLCVFMEGLQELQGSINPKCVF